MDEELLLLLIKSLEKRIENCERTLQISQPPPKEEILE